MDLYIQIMELSAKENGKLNGEAGRWSIGDRVCEN